MEGTSQTFFEQRIEAEIDEFLDCFQMQYNERAHCRVLSFLCSRKMPKFFKEHMKGLEGY